MAGLTRKPSWPRVYRKGGAPSAVFLLDAPRQTRPGDSGDVADLMGQVPAGTRVGGCAWASGPFGACLALDGTGYVDLGLPQALAVSTGPVTLECWFRCDAAPSTYNAGLLTQTGPAGSAAAAVCSLEITTGGNLQAELYDGVNNPYVRSSAYLPGDGLWHQACLVRGGGTLTLYLDGAPVGSVSDTSGNLNQSTQVWSIGRRADFYGSPFTGRVALARVWNGVALSASEVAREYADPLRRLRPPRPDLVTLAAADGASPPAPMAPGSPRKPRWPRLYRKGDAPARWFLLDAPRRTFPGDSGDIADLTGNVAAGVRHGGCTWSQGGAGACLSFDGSTGYATLPKFVAGSTFAFSVRARALNTSGVQAILAQTDYTTGNAFCLFWNYSGQVRFRVGAGGSTFDLNAALPALGVEHLYHATYDGATQRLFIDGALAASQSAAGTVYDSGSTELHLGDYGAGGSDGNYFAGTIDDVRFWSRPLGAAQIAREWSDPYWRLRPAAPSLVTMAASEAPGFKAFWVRPAPLLGSGIY